MKIKNITLLLVVERHLLERIQQGGIGEGGCRDHARAICRVDLVTNKTKQKQDLGPVRADYVGFV